MYRPQFPHSLVPPPCEDETCQYSFDQTNLPALTGTLAAGNVTGRIPLKLDKDAAFLLRAIKIQGTISMRLEDPNGNPLSDFENATIGANYELPNQYGNSAGAGVVVLESGGGGVFAPASGNFLMYLYNGTGAGVSLTSVAINLIGVKRYDEEKCL